MYKYLNDFDRLHVDAKMTDYHLIYIILNSITSCLDQAMAHYEELRADAFQWKNKLVHMDLVATRFQRREQDKKPKDQEKHGCWEDQRRWRREELRSEKKKHEFVPKEVWEKRKVDRRCMKCGRSNH